MGVSETAALSSISGEQHSNGIPKRLNNSFLYLLDEARIRLADSDSLFIYVVKLSVKLIRYQLFTVFWFRVSIARIG